MRFKNGSRVEVLSKSEVPFGAWHPAEIVSRKGRYYKVKYGNVSCIESSTVVEKVSRKVLRPCPPRVEGVNSWTTGDVVEVFIFSSWKVAMVFEIFSTNFFHVRLFGCCEEYRVHISNIRVRQSWKDDKWIVILKGSGSSENMKFSKVSAENWKRDVPSLISKGKNKLQGRYDFVDNHRSTALEGSHFISFRTLKRASPYQSSYLQAYAGERKKMRKDKEQSEHRRVISGYQSTLLNKVDAVAYPQEKLGETCMYSCFSNRTLRYYEQENGKHNHQINCSFAIMDKHNDSNSDASSVGSCSVVSYSHDKLPSHNLAVPSRKADMLSSDAESSFGRGDLDEKCTSLPPEEDLLENIHRIELHAYKCILVAFYVSGSLSWKQEEMLTDLRLSLNISNDEYLMELGNLISDGRNPLGLHCGYASLASKMMHGFATCLGINDWAYS